MRQVVAIIGTFVGWTLVGIMTKVMFMLMYGHLVLDAGVSDWLSVIGNGLRLDFAIAGYLTILQGLILVIVPLNQTVRKVYVMVAALIYSVAIVSNLGLYGYWGFPLDSTPLLYIKTSPADAMASVTVWQMVGGLISVLLITTVEYLILKLLYVSQKPIAGVWQDVSLRLLSLLLSAVMIIPIRGGFGTGTNHTGSVYFSQNMRLNHAAVNPAFSFMESVLHSVDKISDAYSGIEEQEALQMVKHLGLVDNIVKCDKEKTVRPINVVMIGLESFSDTIMHIPGVTPFFNHIASESWHFTNIYGNTFRTDRALVSMLSAVPSLPGLSLMDLPQVSTTLPSIARTLGNAGYSTKFYYGGDTNYSNMRSYIVGTGYQEVVSDRDFPSKMRTGKWGVADGPVYDRILSDLSHLGDGDMKMQEPFFITMMTESSHEPFDVPNHRVLEDPILNAFNYADSCLGNFIGQLRQTTLWENTLVIMIPDHLGAWPREVDNYAYWRYHLPLIMTGGVIDGPKQIITMGSQMDIAATLMGIIGMDCEDFSYSKDLLNDSIAHFGYFSFPDAVGMVTDSARVIYDYTQRQEMCAEGNGAEAVSTAARALMQIYSKEIDKKIVR